MRGRRSKDSAGAVSRSKEERADGADRAVGAVGADGARRREGLRSAELRDILGRLAESTSAIWRCRPATAVADGAARFAVARCRRTPAPRSATAAKKSMAFRSDGVGTHYDARAPRACVIATPHAGY
jgi:hypothetical protein